MNLIQFDHSLIQKIEKMSNLNKDHGSLEWFIVGFLYGIQAENKIIESIFDEVHAISLLMKDSQFSKVEYNDLLLLMVNNKMKSKVSMIFLLIYKSLIRMQQT